MESIKIECRNCNTYIDIDKKNYKYKCHECGFEEDLVVVNEKYIKKRADK